MGWRLRAEEGALQTIREGAAEKEARIEVVAAYPPMAIGGLSGLEGDGAGPQGARARAVARNQTWAISGAGPM